MSIIEQRLYVLKPLHGPPEWFRIYEEQGLRPQTEILGDLIGYFAVEVGELNAVTSLWRYESFEQRLARRAVLAADPRWLAFMAAIRPMLARMENRLLTPAPFSPIK